MLSFFFPFLLTDSIEPIEEPGTVQHGAECSFKYHAHCFTARRESEFPYPLFYPVNREIIRIQSFFVFVLKRIEHELPLIYGEFYRFGRPLSMMDFYGTGLAG